MYINLFNWLVKIRTIKVSVLYDMHERSNSTFWEISIRRQRDVVKVRIFEKVKTGCSLDSHPNRNRSYETSQTDSDSYWGQCPILPSAFGGGALGQRRKTSSGAPDWPRDTWSCKVVFSCVAGLRSWAGSNIHIHVCKIGALLRIKQQLEKAIS